MGAACHCLLPKEFGDLMIELEKTLKEFVGLAPAFEKERQRLKKKLHKNATGGKGKGHAPHATSFSYKVKWDKVHFPKPGGGTTKEVHITDCINLDKDEIKQASLIAAWAADSFIVDRLKEVAKPVIDKMEHEHGGCAKKAIESALNSGIMKLSRTVTDKIVEELSKTLHAAKAAVSGAVTSVTAAFSHASTHTTAIAAHASAASTAVTAAHSSAAASTTQAAASVGIAGAPVAAAKH
eukprot:gnl/Spiro4/3441_TR1679_c0_g1_i1.p1 gnl/Spiro4/3441_TR1679_c0_g1~~gnl/Spiro4/3441_TR1679_c0_g1_i1.p1  ORF type:complete len:238 (-),score=89.15 gnl/Spiro4/3441_TR1679_c0_g1_i1:192-905(-)